VSGTDEVSLGPAVLAGHRTAGSLLCVEPEWAGPEWAGPDGTGPDGTGPGRAGLDRAGRPIGELPSGFGPGVTVMPLAGPAVLVNALADDALTLRRRLCPQALRPAPALVCIGATG
jgi:urease accessory protein